eukprot:3161899-Karenia_brevis.AAC.1
MMMMMMMKGGGVDMLDVYQVMLWGASSHRASHATEAGSGPDFVIRNLEVLRAGTLCQGPSA